MTYTVADLDMANRHVEEGAKRIADLKQQIAAAQARGLPNDLAQRALATMLVTMNHMIDHQRTIAASLAKAPPLPS